MQSKKTIHHRGNAGENFEHRLQQLSLFGLAYSLR